MTTRTITICIILLGTVVGAALLFLPREKPLRNFPPSGRTVVILGDSLAAGVGASIPDRGFVGVLATRLNMSIINAGKSGDTTADGLARFETDVLAHDPDIVLIELGGNDHLRQVPIDTTFANLEKLITTAEEHGAIVILLGIRGGLFGDTFEEQFEELATTCGCAYVPDILDGIFGDARFMADAIHPNDRGHEKIADKVAPILDGIMRAAPNVQP